MRHPYDATVLQERADKLGIITSTGCALHCAAGAALGGATGFGRVFADERVETAAVTIALLVACGALSVGYRRHRRVVPGVLGLVGASTWIAAGLAHDAELVELALSVSGALMLAVAHWLNLRLYKDEVGCETDAPSAVPSR